MPAVSNFLKSTIGKKILMALTGFVLAGFVLIHMLGNLQFFIGPEAINSYAHHLQTLPPPILWGFRGVLLLSVIIHVWMAILVSREKASARPEGYQVKKSVQATYASRTMMMSGIILLSFICFHIAHFTLKVAPQTYTPESFLLSPEDGPSFTVPNIYKMMVDGFKDPWISLFYVVGTGALCFHLSHGVSSMFQTMGLRNETWRYRLNWLALIYGVGVFAGFAIIPVSVMMGWRS
jgi:succinate dehydrogenase / fumarate reductase cytochrome b subunit